MDPTTGSGPYVAGGATYLAGIRDDPQTWPMMHNSVASHMAQICPTMIARGGDYFNRGSSTITIVDVQCSVYVDLGASPTGSKATEIDFWLCYWPNPMGKIDTNALPAIAGFFKRPGLFPGEKMGPRQVSNANQLSVDGMQVLKAWTKKIAPMRAPIYNSSANGGSRQHYKFNIPFNKYMKGQTITYGASPDPDATTATNGTIGNTGNLSDHQRNLYICYMQMRDTSRVFDSSIDATAVDAGAFATHKTQQTRFIDMTQNT